ncbi:4-hydroxy-tetrahydrodipicolinate synthase [Desulfovibrio aminophilus]|nr:4-hydroxy-tetrahydrodipicolinate synthase [Desulfovibrio aminophilus]MCM0754292.1 4-hydroxy-tetrahydrodipicolinate synthase [Desulfovibrio aminophilus]
MKIRGAFTALVTPFRDGQVDEDAYRRHVEWQIEQGIDGLVPCGTTGEAATMDHEEQGRVIRMCVEQVKGRVPVIAGAGSNSTREAIELTRLAKEAGADATLQITPYYNKPTPDGLVGHFKAIAKAVPLPMIIYNVPGRTGLNLAPKTLARIAREVPEAIGVKEATGDLKQCTEVVELCGTDFLLLSGDDFTVLPLLSVGGMGVISVVSNLIPAKMHGLCAAYFEGDQTRAKALNIEIQALSRAMFMETNPIPVKTALAYMGRCLPGFRLPLAPLEEKNAEPLKTVLKAYGLLQ